MSAPKLLGVYTARFPYIEAAKDKVRPVIVISKPYSQFGIIAIVPISSKAILQAVDVALDSWKGAGLARASVARIHRMTTILQADLLTELGRLDSKDTKTLKASLRDYLDL